jgi:predicted RNA-binding protein with PIN domain
VRTLLVDGNNVMGAGARGWWRDRGGASRALLHRLSCYARATERPLVLVFDVPQPDLPEGDYDGVILSYATRRGRNAGDDRIRALLGAGDPAAVEVVTSDRELAVDAQAAGALVTGAGTFLAAVRAAGC